MAIVHPAPGAHGLAKDVAEGIRVSDVALAVVTFLPGFLPFSTSAATRSGCAMSGKVLLVRHTAVAVHWAKRCYGDMDVGLSRAGRQQAASLAVELATSEVRAVVHSGLKRTAYLAELVANRAGVVPTIDVRWRERHFGAWEGRSWQSLWKEVGEAMNGLVTDPERYRPAGGETTAELAARALAAWHSLPKEGVTIVVSHGGPIAAVRTLIAGAPLTQILHYRVDLGSVLALTRDISGR